jgi:hypothetical protein
MDIEYTEPADFDAVDEYHSDAESVVSTFDSDDDTHNENPYILVPCRPKIQWTLIKIGKSVLEVSSIGTIKPYRSLDISSEGTLLPGTPFRYYRIEEETGKFVNYFVHEIVWQAFNGYPTDDYEIRHKPEYTAKHHLIYSNRLHNITLVPKIRIMPLKLFR